MSLRVGCAIIFLSYIVCNPDGKSELDGISEVVAASKAAIAGSMAKEYERRAHFNAEQAKVMKTKAEKFKFYMEQFAKRGDLLQKRIVKHKNLAKTNHNAAQLHEKKSAELASKSRMSREKANQLEAIKAEYLRRVNNEYRSYGLEKIKAQVAQTKAKDLEAEVKHYLDWALDLIKKSEELRLSAELQKKHAAESKNKAETEIKTAQSHEKQASNHLNKAKTYEAKVSDLTLKIKEAYRLYEEFMVSASAEKNLSREKRVKATDEEMVAKVYGQAAVDMKTTTDIQKSEYNELKTQAEAAEKASKLYHRAAEEVMKSANSDFPFPFPKKKT